MIIYTSLLKRGITVTPSLILIPQWARWSAPYLAHEQCHADQMRRVGVLWYWWRYLTHQPFRVECEVQAYKAQVAAGGDLISAAYALAGLYRVGMPVDDAYKLLTKD